MSRTKLSYIVSLLKILFGTSIFFISPDHPYFFVPFLLTGFFDFLGENLLKLDSTTYGRDKMLSSIGTLVFVLAGSFRLIPIFLVSKAVYGWLFLIGLLVIWNLTSEYFLYGKLIYIDSSATRIVKVFIYLFPLLTTFVEKEFLLICICVIATFAEMQLGHFIRMKTTEKDVI